MNRFVGILGLVVVLVFSVACGEDEVKSDEGSSRCGEMETFNPILKQCEPLGFNNSANSEPGNNGGNVGNNGTPQNSGNSNTLDAGMGGDDASMTDDATFDVPDLPCGLGSVIGRACAPSGDILAAADVKISGTDCDGNTFEVTTRTTGDGTFEFDEVPSGTHTLDVTTGSFNASKGIFVRANMLNDYTAASEKVCVDANVKLAVIEGAYDKVEDVLTSLNLSYDVKGGDSTEAKTQEAFDFLSDANAMSQYDVVLVNCGEMYNRVLGIDPLFGFPTYPFGRNAMMQITSALQSFVAQGGSLYVSDWASPFFEAAFPTLIDFHGDDTNLAAPRWGYAPQVITADVMSPALQTTLGANTATIDFPHNPPTLLNNNWVVATAVDPSVTVHLAGDAVLCQNQQCQSGGQTQTAAPLLVSKTQAGGGTVIFTSFHNHSDQSAPITPETEMILRFLILQL